MLKHGKHFLVSPQFVIRQCLVQLLTSGKSFIESVCKHLGVTETVCNPLCREWVFVITRIAHECPSWAIRLTQEIWNEAGSGKPLGTLARIESFGKCRSDLPDRAHEF